MQRSLHAYMRDRWRLIHESGARFTALRLIAKWLCPEFRMRWCELDWTSDDEFNEYLALTGQPASINSGRRWMVYQLLRLSQNIPGDTVECGAYRGGSSYLICASNAQSQLAKAHHLFDSWQGLSEPSAIDGKWRQHDRSADIAEAKSLLSSFKNVHFYQGWIPERFPEVSARNFSFIHIDVDLHDPTKESIEFFYPRLNAGGIIVCDDYGFSDCRGATMAIDDFLKDKPEKMIALSDGGGFLIKGAPAADRYSLI
jgi:hypothetical protein